LSYAEYQEQLKQKNASLGGNKKPTKVVESDLQLQEKKEDLSLGVTANNQGQKKVKAKEKKVDKKEEELNQIVGANLKTDDGYRPRKYDNQENKQYGKKQAGPKFNFKKEDFPEL